VALFLSTYVNKIDRKGRVSVPASFRQALQGQTFHGIICFPSYKLPCLEACAMDRMEQMAESMDDLDLFSDDQDDLSASIFADSYPLALDADGRIILPTDLAAHAGIDFADAGRAAFVGRGRTFQIWNPETFETHKNEARRRAETNKPKLKLRHKPEEDER